MDHVLGAVADPNRRLLLERLRIHGPASIVELSAGLPITRQGVTKHLDVLQDAGLVLVTRKGRRRVHALAPEPLREIDEWLRPYAAVWDSAATRLGRLA